MNASQMPERTVRRTMRRSCAPIAWAAMGATAPTTPMPNSMMQMKSALARAPAATYLHPSQPRTMTSVVNSALRPSWATISGQASLNSARSSVPQLCDDDGVSALDASAG